MPELLLDRLMRRVVGVIVAGLRPLGRLLNGELLALLQAGGFGALESMVEGWLSSSRGAALAIASVLFIVGVLVKFTPGLSRRMREGGQGRPGRRKLLRTYSRSAEGGRLGPTGPSRAYKVTGWAQGVVSRVAGLHRRRGEG
ncbi:MAG: hypothetical protein QXG25_03620 [Nitrososphaerota archaeon]